MRRPTVKAIIIDQVGAADDDLIDERRISRR
jgi:hypothetical protein